MSLLLGTHEIEITPNLPISLAGFAHREGKAMEVHSPLFLKTYYLEKENQAFLLMIGDVIWWDDRTVQKWRNRLASEYSLKKESICFHATHNHSGPQTSDAFTSLLGEIEPSFIESLEEKIVKSVRYALNNKEPVTIKRSQTTGDIGVYRRLKDENNIRMMPNPNVPINKDVTMIKFENEKQETKAMLIHFSCHPTSTDANIVSAEYTGVCCSRLKEKYPQAVVGFLQGCCGDVRPALIKGNEFYRGNLRDMEAIGNQLAEDILSGGKEESIICRHIQGRYVKLPLHFKTDYAVNEEIEHEVLEIWKKHIRKNETLLEIQYVEISPELRFIFFNGEMVQGYGEYIRRLDPRVLALGYSNGMIGYIPTQTQALEGGYEAEEFIYYFGLPAPFHIETEKRIQTAIDNILEGE
ncbi:neutral/alkaline non-lysosomal ceramidase N-terminal domain-containing protein [Bacillus sp. JJ1521]|uniref:neutral/alkaline non-lysosomal ceramidase N-terminal domain-containing protein n=1 Tax=Bacillus sp. JJ1521 TaxID=3122957 RepID=UPI002FFE2E00